MRLAACAAALCLTALSARAAPLLSDGPPLDAGRERAGKLAALAFHLTLFGDNDPAGAAQRYLAPDFRNHDLEQPSGARTFAGFFLRPAEYGNPDPAAPRHGPSPSAALSLLFAITDGELTMLACPGAGSDPGARFGSNLFEVGNGRITQMWYAGPLGPPSSANTGTGEKLGQLTVIVPSGSAPAAVREANKALVERFFTDFFIRGEQKAARVLAPDLISHVPGVASGAGFALVARKHQDLVTAPDVQTTLFILAEGDLVDVGFPVPYAGDPGAWYDQNILRVKDGRIVEWWYSGYPAGHPRRLWRMPTAH